MPSGSASIVDPPIADRAPADRPLDPSIHSPLAGRTTDAPGATLAEVAAEAGVSIATASRVLNSSTRVSTDAYQRVCAAASRLGYRRHRAAWGHTHQPVRAVAAVLHAGHRRVFNEPFFERFLGAAEAELARSGVPMLVMNATGPSIETVARYLSGRHVDGAILVADHGPLPLSGPLATLGLPLTVIGRPLQPSTVPYVDADNRGGARAAVEHLLAAGRERIAHIAAPPDTGAGADRLAGYRETMRAAGVVDLPVAYGDWGQASAAHAMQRLLDQRPNLDAVFVASDLMATGAIRALRRAGRRVPDDIAVVGFDDHPLARQMDLTTVRQPIEELAALAARRVLAATGGVDVLKTELIIRKSA
ncbi:LacI family DNA-binding transcriptional regulator [Hamadaea tsunoensis]|uniref:LacI family DNA-binding transcriptional regulator n=1 Tax=Hamadaea tsunoensis TaxID=53368 RepID=UPI0009FEA516|nr:LacI family DNA-binding transcriptional regulator [Hamadaea tsunoensis]